MIAVIYYAYGAPKSLDEIDSYFSHVMNGKKLPEAMLNNIKMMFKQSGYPDFIKSSTERIAKGIKQLLQATLTEEVEVFTAYKHTEPFVPTIYEQAKNAGATKIVTLSVNPIFSPTGGGAVHTEVATLNEGQSIPHIMINDFHLDHRIVSLYADRVKRAFEWLPSVTHEQAHVLFTVHSQAINENRNASYVGQFEQLATAIAEKAGIKNYHITYRSGRGAGWLGPDVKEAMKSLTKDGAKGFVTCELLSVTADVESYAEINTECREVAKELEVEFAVSEFLGDSFDTVFALANLIEERLKLIEK